MAQCLQGESISEPPSPEIEAGYSLAGWQTQDGITITFPFTPSENIELTANIVPLEFVSWAEATGTQIVAICNALKLNVITLDELNNRTNNGWVLGAEKIVTLSAMPTYNYTFNGEIYTIEAHAEQQVTYVLANIGAPKLEDESDTITRVDGGEISFVVAQKDSLKEKGYINPVVSNTGSWQDCARRKWCNEIYYEAIPSVFANCIKQANVITAESQQGVDVQITEDYCFLPAAKEVLGGSGLKAGDTYDPYTQIGNFANYYECIKLSQLLYYVVDSEHKRKAVNGSYFDYWSRSPFYPSGYTGFHSVTSGGFCGNNYGCDPTKPYGLAPMFVIGGDI